MIINSNIPALNTINQLAKNDKAANSSLAKLSSGLRINSAADDAAGLSISEKMKGQINGLDQASRNAQDGISMVQTAEGALNETTSILQRMRDLATQSANDTNTATDRQSIQAEVDQLSTEITRISNTTQFNGQTLLNGAMTSNGVAADTLQIGANTGQTMNVSIDAMDAASLGVARSGFSATVASGATNVSSATVSAGAVGTSVVNGATVTVSTSQAALTNATATVNGLDFSSDTAAGTTLNGKTISIAQGTSTGATASTLTVDGSGNYTFTIGTDSSGSTLASTNTAFATQINDAITAYNTTHPTATAGLGTVTVDSSVTASASPAAVATTSGVALAGGTNDTTKTAVTLSTSTGSQVITVNNTDTSVNVTSGDFNGLTINFGTGNNASTTMGNIGTVNLSQSVATSAKFSGHQKTADASASFGIDVSSSASAASNAITVIDNAINSVSMERGKLGAIQNRLDHTINNLNTSSQNLSSAESQITDVDMAKEMSTYTKDSILQQAAQSMLAKANQAPQNVLQLLR